MNLRTKLQLASSCLILIVVIGTMTSLYISEKNQILREIRREQSEDLEKLGRVCEESLLVADEVALINYAQKALLLSTKVSYAGYVDQNGNGWYVDKKATLNMVDASKDPTVNDIIDYKRVLRREMVFQGEPVIELSQPVKGRGYVRLGYSQERVNELFRDNLRQAFKRFWVVGLMAILFGLILSHLLSSALSRPIASLMEGAESIAKGQKGVKIPEGGRDELGRLTRTFNHMSEELAKLDQLKDDFMSHVTHELRSPLTSIIATVELLAEMPLTNQEPKLKRSVDRLIYGSERLNRLVDNILDLTRMEAGKMMFDIQPVNIGALITEMADFFVPRAAEKGLTIQAGAPADLPMAMADSERIRQVLSNLIYNAIKFTNQGGITIWARVKEGMMQVGVQDTGVGIPKDKIGSLFQKFETLKDTRDRVNKPVPGSGLGLNIVLNSVKAQGGAIWVESEVDKGSAFIFSLPLAQTQEEGALKATPELPADVTSRGTDGSRHAVLMNERKVAI